MPVHLAAHLSAGRHIPGILVLNERLGVGGNVEQLLVIAGASFTGEWSDRIIHRPVR
jgi:hypothetical protein